MAKILDFIKEQAKKAGINVEDDKFKTFFASDALKEVDVPDDLVAPIGAGLITIKDAKNHSEIKNHYYKMALDGIDDSVTKVIGEYELDEDSKNIIGLTKNTYDKPAALAKAIKTAVEKKATAGSADKQKIQQEIDALHAQLRVEKEKVTQAEAARESDRKGMNIQYKIDDMLREYKTIHDGLSPKNKSLIIQTLLKQGVQEKGAKWEIDENDNLVLIKTDGTALYGDNNTQVQPKGFIEKLLSDNKFLVVANNGQSQNSNSGQSSGQSQNNGSGAPNGGQGTKSGSTPGFKNAIQQALADAQGGANPILGSGN